MPELAHIGMCGRLEPVAATRQRSRMTSYARYRPASLRTATPLITSLIERLGELTRGGI